jgi:ParB-like chromosome segregation protein Spo0J
MEIVETGMGKASDFVVSKYNIRKKNIEDGLDALADSIQNFAILKPIMIDADNNEVIDGQKRKLAVELIKKRCGKEILIPYFKIKFDVEEEKLLASLVSNERRTPTDPEDKGGAIRELLNMGFTYEDLEKMVGTPNKSLASYVGQVRIIDEVKEKYPESVKAVENTDYKKKKVISRIMKLSPYADDARKVYELWEQSSNMTLKELDSLEKDTRKKIPVDTVFRATRTIDRKTHEFIPTYVKREYYNKLAARCEAEGVDIAKVTLSLLYAWADYELNVNIKKDL